MYGGALPQNMPEKLKTVPSIGGDVRRDISSHRLCVLGKRKQQITLTSPTVELIRIGLLGERKGIMYNPKCVSESAVHLIEEKDVSIQNHGDVVRCFGTHTRGLDHGYMECRVRPIAM